MASSATPAAHSSARTPRSMFVDLRPRLRLVAGDLETATTPITDHPVQERLLQLRPLVQQHVTELRATVGLRRSRGLQAVQSVVLRHAGEAVMDQIRSRIAARQAHEGRSLGVRRADPPMSTKTTRSTLIGDGQARLLVLADAATVISRSIPGRLRRAVSVLQGLAEGRPDQGVRLTTRDEVGDESRGSDTGLDGLNSSAEIRTEVEGTASIVQQIELLALDAAIDARRADEAGKGSIVVANEVRAPSPVAPVPVGAKEYAAARSRAHGPTTALWHAVQLHRPVGEVDGTCEVTICGSLVRVSPEQRWPVAARDVCPACATLAH